MTSSFWATDIHPAGDGGPAGFSIGVCGDPRTRRSPSGDQPISENLQDSAEQSIRSGIDGGHGSGRVESDPGGCVSGAGGNGPTGVGSLSLATDVIGPDAPSIDLVQVMAANQTLLKNIFRKIDALENQVARLEKQVSQQRQLAQRDVRTRLLLEAPPPPVVAWHPSREPDSLVPAQNLAACKVSWLDRWLRPWKLRRNRETSLDQPPAS